MKAEIAIVGLSLARADQARTRVKQEPASGSGATCRPMRFYHARLVP